MKKMSENNEEIKTKLKKCREEVKEDYHNMSRDPTSEEFQMFTLQTIESLIQIIDLVLNHAKFE